MNDEIYSGEPNPISAPTPGPMTDPLRDTVSLPPTPPAAPTTPTLPPTPAQKSSIVPFMFGLLFVLILAGALGVGYYFFKLRSEMTASPTPSASSSPTPSVIPSVLPSSTPLATKKPVATKPLVKPTSTPTPLTSFDIRFGNPSANVKQTYDDGSGAGRVINREYTSIEAGQFDELPASWNPNVTVCFHMVASDTIPGANVKYSLQVDGNIIREDTMAQYDKMEGGRLYDLCYGTNISIGKHSLVLLLNGDKSVKENNYTNDMARIDYENLADNVAPNFSLGGPYDWGTQGTCLLTQSISDNVTPLAQLKIEQQIDNGSWASFSSGQYCFTGKTGDPHTYSVKVTDARGNVNQQNRKFTLF